jgi:catalase
MDLPDRTGSHDSNFGTDRREVRADTPATTREMDMRSGLRLAALMLLGLPGGVAMAQDAAVPDLQQRLPAQLVKDFHGAFGDLHVRAVHAKGVIAQGTFAPSVEAKGLSSAAVFERPVPVVVRFSDFTGIPDIPDTSGSANPRGFAVKFLMPDGSNLDIVTHNFNGFPVATAGEFSMLLQALGHSGAGIAAPTPFDRFLQAHPIAKTFFATQKPAPESFATTAYFGVNAFLFTDAAGHSRPVRYRFVPLAGEHYLDEATTKTRSPDYLRTEIVERLGRQPVRFEWFAQLGQAGDAIDDPSIAWPDDRTLVKLGVITIDRAGPNTALADQHLLFLPGSLLPGIGIADPMVTIRNAAYPVSFHERQP